MRLQPPPPHPSTRVGRSCHRSSSQGQFLSLKKGKNSTTHLFLPVRSHVHSPPLPLSPPLSATVREISGDEGLLLYSRCAAQGLAWGSCIGSWWAGSPSSHLLPGWQRTPQKTRQGERNLPGCHSHYHCCCPGLSPTPLQLNWNRAGVPLIPRIAWTVDTFEQWQAGEMGM